jgi:glycosyltransferase involved in cell wall biosynthesis
MKVIQILPELNAGGVERGTLEIADFLSKQGHEAIVISNGGRMVEALEASGARHIAMPVHRKSLVSLLQVLPLRRLMEKERPDILHIRSRVPGWIAYLAWRGMSPKTRPRLVSTVHGFYSVNRYSAIMTKGERVIAVSESTRQYILKSYPQTPPSLIRVIPRGIDPADYGINYQPPRAWLYQWQQNHPELIGKKLLLLPGRITRLKGHSDFFKLISELKKSGQPVCGLIAGNTHPKKQAYLNELQQQAKVLGISEDIIFLGHRSDLRELMAISDIIMALSQQPESFGRTALEALALGKPVIGYDCGGVGELLTKFFPQGAVPLGKIPHMINAATSVIRNNSIPTGISKTYTLDSMCRSTLAVYKELAR